MCQRRFPQSRGAIQENMVQCFASALGRRNGDAQIILYLTLSGKVIKTAWPEVGIQRRILSVWFTGDYP